MTSRNQLSSEQKQILLGLWDEGMTTLKRKDLLRMAIERTGLDEEVIKVDL